MKLLGGNGSKMNEPHHVHYCDKCKHWYLCERTGSTCEFISGSVSSHRRHIASMPIYTEYAVSKISYLYKSLINK